VHVTNFSPGIHLIFNILGHYWPQHLSQRLARRHGSARQAMREEGGKVRFYKYQTRVAQHHQRAGHKRKENYVRNR